VGLLSLLKKILYLVMTTIATQSATYLTLFLPALSSSSNLFIETYRAPIFTKLF